MEIYVNVNDKELHLEGIKDPTLKNKLTELTKQYLAAIYEEIGANEKGEVMKLNFSGVLVSEPKLDCCCICMTECNKNDGKTVVPDCGCVHKYYHEDCLKRWFQRKKRCPTCNRHFRGKGYHKHVWENPYGSSVKSQKIWRCCGGTHKKKSTFKSIASALKHANEKHNINLRRGKVDGENVWICNEGSCEGHVIRTDELALAHLQIHHHSNVITEKEN